MANKDYQEGGAGAGLPEKVKGKMDQAGAGFKPFSNPDGSEDEQKFDGSKVGVSHPEDSQKKLPGAK